MEIIHLILGKANLERMNGVNKVVYQLAERQSLAGKNVSVWGITKNTTHNYGARNFKTVLFQAHKNPFFIDPLLKKAIKTLDKETIVHLHGGWIPIYATIVNLLYREQIHFILTPHGAYNSIAMLRSKWMKKIYFLLFEKNILKKSASIHCIGASEIIGLNSIFTNNKTFLLPYGFTVSNVNYEESNTKENFIIGYLGRIDIYTKGLDLIVKAFQSVSKNITEAKLWIVGGGEDSDRLEQLINDAKLNDKVIIWGSKFGNEKDALLQKMNVFIHPSRNEGQPSAVIEAASFKVPCIVSQATNLSTYIEKYGAGISIANNDFKALANAIEKIYFSWKSDTLSEMKNNAKRMVIDEFNWDRIIVALDQEYKKALIGNL